MTLPLLETGDSTGYRMSLRKCIVLIWLADQNVTGGRSEPAKGPRNDGRNVPKVAVVK